MALAPCEARKYLGVGDTDAGDPRPTCKCPIQWRVSFMAYDADAASGESRQAIAYFCTDHRDALVALMAMSGDVLADAGVSGVDVRRYEPRVADRAQATPETVRRSLVATRAAIVAGAL